MRPRYAAGTAVPEDKSRREIEEQLLRHGAKDLSFAYDAGHVVYLAHFPAGTIRFAMVLPARPTAVLLPYQTRQGSVPTGAQRRWEQACREQWRALLLYIKAKFAAIDARITSFDEAFLGHRMLPGGRSVAALVVPQLKTGTIHMLPASTARSQATDRGPMHGEVDR
jgi:hypothetical protein